MNRLHQISQHLTACDICKLIITDSSLDSTYKTHINTAQDYISALLKNGQIDQSDTSHLISMLKLIKRHDLVYILLGEEPEEYSASESGENIFFPPPSTEPSGKRSASKQGRSRKAKKRRAEPEVPEEESPTCDIVLSMAVKNCDQEKMLAEIQMPPQVPQVEDKNNYMERFDAALAHLCVFDMGNVMCTLTFSKLEDLDSFWRDYNSGILAESLKGIVITKRLLEQMNQPNLKLLIYVDAEQYRTGREKLVRTKAL